MRKRNVRCEPCRGEDRLDALERDELADKERAELWRRLPAGTEQSVLGADETDLDDGELSEVSEKSRVRLRVGDHEIRAAKGVPIDRLERTGYDRPRTEAPPVADERVGQRDKGVEDDRSPPRCSARGREVEVAGVADDESVEAAGSAPEQSRLGNGELRGACWSGGPALAQPVPDGDVLLVDVDACAP